MHPIDWQLIEILQAEGKATYGDLARRVGMSQAAVHERVKKLESRGVVRGYRADVDPAAIGLPVVAFIFVDQEAGARRADLPRAFAEIRNVVACHSVAGQAAYVLKVRAHDTVGLERIINAVRSVEGVAQTRTTIVLSTWFEDRPMVPPAVPEELHEEPPHVGDGRWRLRRYNDVAHLR